MGAHEFPSVAINRQDWSFRRVGPQNEQRHNEKVKEAIKDNLPTIISDGSIITADPQSRKPVKVPMRSLELPRIRYKSGNEGVSTGDGSEQVGDIIDQQPGRDGPGNGQGAGDQPGVEYYEVEFTVEELQQMVFADLGLPNLQPRKKQEIASEVPIFDDIRKKRTSNNLDLYRTIYANIYRNAEERGKAEIRSISPDDFRVKTWREDVKEENSAVVLAMADISGSMGEFEKYITRAFCWWTVGFLRHKYPKVDIAFIAHDTQAHEVTEDQFFKRGTGGGTKCSSANELAINLINSRYSPDQYNIYPLHFSDGDNYGQDDDRCVTLIQEMLDKHISQYAYIQIGDRQSSLKKAYEEKVKDERMKVVTIGKKEDVHSGLKKVFPPETAS